ncbi:hypothetical protein MVLG_06009 [Microbotryum lychnidis-dioicae p1A1 Lamole]|uniref:AAA+ ATPase domain-containing protein n=1 Tax=Microbotryum lychnidis-dioicae (strain p1A1 Lamole / MvSl-1064) TaxID=683840 RepID=U5HFY7_USTV1|nr:hypothetical protein MVLG_06009 [Microbotryum lychnidis-dioicae p1A1 Lamole]|eukprot:KDE03496.1 hypothetical protein MVLG_06009 [Microbotryum lychnidis-dioicae p1A1 Lamole]
MSSSSRWGRSLIHQAYHPQSHQVSSSALGRGGRDSGQSASASTIPFVRAIHTSSTSAAVEGVLPKRNGERNGPPPIAPLPTPPPRTSSFSKLKARTIPTRSQSHVKDVSHIGGAHADDPVGEMYYEMDVSDAVDEIPYDDLVSALYATRKTPLADEQDLGEEGVQGIEGLFKDVEGDSRKRVEESLDWQVLLDELATRDHREGSKVGTTKAKAREIEEPKIVSGPKPTTTTTITSSSMEIKPSKFSTSQIPVPVSTPIPASTRAPMVKAIPAIITPTKRLPPLGKARDLNPSPRPIGILPYTPPSNVSPTDPSSRPLLSRYDWRLSSPLPRPSPSLIPPPLDIPTSNLQQGANKLVGVGQAPYFSGRRIKDVEGWGWKGRVPQGEKGTWRAADRHRIKLDRLLDLTEEAEEKSYLATLARSGTPEQRETSGRTVCRAQGMWLTKSKRTDEILKMTREEKDEVRRKSAGGGGVISTWRNCEGGDLDEANGYKFVPGTILRFTPLKPEDVGSGPVPPPSHASKHPQGSVLEVQNGRLIVIFEEADMWVLGQEEYRIDIGVDDASYHLQRAAIDSLYFDSARQRLRNERTWQAAHMAFAKTKLCPTVREWTLQGTDVRELIVPTEATPAVEVVQNSADFPFDELIDGPGESVTASMTQVEETTPTPASNPSPLLCDNQLINSWVKRHQRCPPLAMEGDPILRLNDSQTRAVAMAMSESLSLIQGPPGTGKSATLVTLVHLLKTHFRIPQPILLCAPTHVSIDHLLSLLIDAGLNPLRMGKAHKVREELREWTVERRREGHPLWELCEGARVGCERIREELGGLRETVGDDKKGLERIMEMEEILKNEWRRFVTLEQRLYSSLLATADVFCSTTIGAGATKIMSMTDFPIVFLDEAAMCTEPVSLIPLMKGAQHVCLIGDQKQLPAVVKSREAVQNRLHVSLFERLMAEKAVQTTLLDTQYRMRPQISAFPNQAFYNSALKDAPNVLRRSSPPKSTYLQMNAETGEPDPCVFISHEGAETFFRQSTLNETEVDLIVSIVGDLLTRNPELDASTIGIISPYASQTRLLSDTFSIGDRRGFSSRVIDRWGFDIALRASQVEVNTVDGYQGREKSIIILSTVRSNAANFIGFLSDRRRLNVALTRAKDLLFVAGNERTLGFARSGWGGREEDDGDGGTGVWKAFLAWYRARGWIKQWGASGGKGQ